ncbi:MAG: TniQ family protein [Nocardioidaceae bacterium]
MRLEPKAGESWPGYLARSAAAHTVTVPVLVERIDPSWVRRLRFPHALRNTGIAATQVTLNLLADYFSLIPAQIRAMHLLRYDGTALRFRASDLVGFDPIDPRAAHLNRSVARLGWLPDQRTSRACKLCLRDEPEHFQLTWRLPWHIVCDKHSRFITADTSHEWKPVQPSAAALRAQEFVLTLAEGRTSIPDAPTNDVFKDLATLVDGLLWARYGSRDPRRALWQPQHLLDVLPAAVDAAGTSPDDGPSDTHQELFSTRAGRDAIKHFMDHRSSPPSPRMLAHLRAFESTSFHPAGPLNALSTPRHIHFPESRREVSTAVFPQLLPAHIFFGDLSDLSYPLPIHRGRLATGLCCVLAAKSWTFDQAATQLCTPTASGYLVRDLWRRLEAEGRDDAFWAAIGAAALALVDDDVDYASRRNAMRLPHVINAAHAATPRAHRGNVKVWLVDQWACCPTWPRVRTSVLDGTIDALTATSGSILLAAANTASRLPT